MQGAKQAAAGKGGISIQSYKTLLFTLKNESIPISHGKTELLAISY
jgi:hypothetical protein